MRIWRSSRATVPITPRPKDTSAPMALLPSPRLASVTSRRRVSSNGKTLVCEKSQPSSDTPSATMPGGPLADC
jgi:hypothetical protein